METLKHRLEASRREEDGFTLIELMVVVLIIAILLAIAIPTFLGAQNKAKDRAAQSSLRNSLTAAKTVATDSSGDFTKATPGPAPGGTLAGVETSLAFVDGATASDDPKKVSINTPAADQFYAAAYSKSGACFFIRDIPSAAGKQYAKAAGGEPCTSNQAETTAGTWDDKF
jgi:type IV pilus assembly protein PilA